MTATFRHETLLAATVEQVFAVLTDPELHAARYAAAGATGARVSEARATPDGGLVVVSQRSEAGGLPRQVSRLVRGAAQLVQTETWAPPAGDGARLATWRVETRGVPVEITGSTELRAAGEIAGAAQSRLVESGSVTARLPMIGAVVEKVAGEQSASKLTLEWEWLAARLVERLAGSGG